MEPGDNTVNFCTTFGRLNFLLTKNMALWAVTLTKNELEISALFRSGKQRLVISSTGIFGFTNELKRVPCIQARNKDVILFSSNRHEDKHLDEKNMANLKTQCITTPLKFGSTVW
jgi:hypothetical protein